MQRRLFLLIALLLPAAPLAGRRRDNEEKCARLDDMIRRVQAERRAGYTAKRGRRLQARREELDQQRRELCR